MCLFIESMPLVDRSYTATLVYITDYEGYVRLFRLGKHTGSKVVTFNHRWRMKRIECCPQSY